MEGVKKFKNTDYTLYLVKNKNLKRFENDIKEKYKNLFTKHSTIVVKNILELQDKSELLETISKYNYNRFSKYKNHNFYVVGFLDFTKNKFTLETLNNFSLLETLYVPFLQNYKEGDEFCLDF